jgi:hypothetical protein
MPLPRPLFRPFLLLAALLATPAGGGSIPPDLDRALRESTYVYIQSERRSGAFGAPAEIWLFYDGGAVWVGTRPTSWRVRRIKAGRRRARIAVGKTDGPSFEATGTLARDPAVEERLMAEFARKYPEGWPRHAASFKDGFRTGERVLVRYSPSP